MFACIWVQQSFGVCILSYQYAKIPVLGAPNWNRGSLLWGVNYVTLDEGINSKVKNSTTINMRPSHPSTMVIFPPLIQIFLQNRMTIMMFSDVFNFVFPTTLCFAHILVCNNFEFWLVFLGTHPFWRCQRRETYVVYVACYVMFVSWCCIMFAYACYVYGMPIYYMFWLLVR